MYKVGMKRGDTVVEIDCETMAEVVTVTTHVLGSSQAFTVGDEDATLKAQVETPAPEPESSVPAGEYRTARGYPLKVGSHPSNGPWIATEARDRALLKTLELVRKDRNVRSDVLARQLGKDDGRSMSYMLGNYLKVRCETMGLNRFEVVHNVRSKEGNAWICGRDMDQAIKWLSARIYAGDAYAHTKVEGPPVIPLATTVRQAEPTALKLLEAVAAVPNGIKSKSLAKMFGYDSPYGMSVLGKLLNHLFRKMGLNHHEVLVNYRVGGVSYWRTGPKFEQAIAALKRSA